MLIFFNCVECCEERDNKKNKKDAAPLLIPRQDQDAKSQKPKLIEKIRSDELGGCTNGHAYIRRAYARRAENIMLTSSPT